MTRASQKVVLGHRRLVASFEQFLSTTSFVSLLPYSTLMNCGQPRGWGCCLVDQLDYHYRQCPSRRRPTPESFTERSHGSSVRETCPLTNATPCTNSLLVKTWPIILPNSFAGRITDDPGGLFTENRGESLALQRGEDVKPDERVTDRRRDYRDTGPTTWFVTTSRTIADIPGGGGLSR
ncbi:hypothetical protein Hlac_3368 (plasmid) [Halorubrum lacusprofundi ATCC 49239]|uniref:Uncharacterized protein n=1 Tax=Halorubrum lacusprofundi (strain ATCC 49239 / DSM 5036 / JCM 8891 / ACAM 34) TaxID=416348 RepID=B9LWP7_HALLT|nr:hypothetical protein Hlac_3368 [Halorubrum lacusprofundi ATCC 49239]